MRQKEEEDHDKLKEMDFSQERIALQSNIVQGKFNDITKVIMRFSLTEVILISTHLPLYYLGLK